MKDKDLDATVPLSAVPRAAAALEAERAKLMLGPEAGTDHATVALQAVKPPPAAATVAVSAVQMGVKPLGPRSAFDGPREHIPDGRATGVRDRKRVKQIVIAMVGAGVIAGSVIGNIPRVWTGIIIMASVVTAAMFIFGGRDAAME
jgi:hypothetical protein